MKCDVDQKENNGLKSQLAADKDYIQLQRLQQVNAQLRVDCDKAKKVSSCVRSQTCY